MAQLVPLFEFDARIGELVRLLRTAVKPMSLSIGSQLVEHFFQMAFLDRNNWRLGKTFVSSTVGLSGLNVVRVE